MVCIKPKQLISFSRTCGRKARWDSEESTLVDIRVNKSGESCFVKLFWLVSYSSTSVPIVCRYMTNFAATNSTFPAFSCSVLASTTYRMKYYSTRVVLPLFYRRTRVLISHSSTSAWGNCKWQLLVTVITQSLH